MNRNVRQGGVPDFTARVESPDSNRVARRDRPMTLEQSLWRSEYMAKAKSRNLKYLDDMRIIQVPQLSAAGGPRLIIVAGAFIKPCSVNMTDLLYYAVKTVDPVVQGPFSVVYFHTDTQLPALLDVGWFSHLHDAIDPAHRENLRSLYIFQPSLRLRIWLLLLKVLEPSIYGKVEFVDNIPALCRLVPGLDPETGVPQHVKDASRFSYP